MCKTFYLLPVSALALEYCQRCLVGFAWTDCSSSSAAVGWRRSQSLRGPNSALGLVQPVTWGRHQIAQCASVRRIATSGGQYSACFHFFCAQTSPKSPFLPAGSAYPACHLTAGATKLGMLEGMKEARHEAVQLQTAGHSAAGGLELQMPLGAEKGEEQGQEKAGRSVTLLLSRNSEL